MTNSSNRQLTQPLAPTYNYLSLKYTTHEYGHHREGNIDRMHRADQLEFNLDKWSDNKPVTPISKDWPNHSKFFVNLAASYSAAE